MSEHGEKEPRIENVPHAWNSSEEQKQSQVQDEEYDGDDLEPVSVVRKLMKHDWNNSSAHGNNEPSAENL